MFVQQFFSVGGLMIGIDKYGFVSDREADLRHTRQQLCDEIKGHLGTTIEGGRHADPNDRATEEQVHCEDLHLHQERPRKYLKKVDDALERIRTGKYGYCDTCGVWIGDRRLEARPTATLCFDCKTLEENVKERQYGRGRGFALA
jgi:RNA polymerase-binding protein DksA